MGGWGARRHSSAEAGQAVTAFRCGQALTAAPVLLSLPPGSQLARNPTVWPAPNGHCAKARADPCPAAAGRGLAPALPAGEPGGCTVDVQQGRAAESLRSSDRQPDKGLFRKTLPRALSATGGNLSPAPEYSSQPGLQNGAKPGPDTCCHPAVAWPRC